MYDWVNCSCTIYRRSSTNCFFFLSPRYLYEIVSILLFKKAFDILLETRPTTRGERGCNKFVPVLGGDGTK